MLQSLWDDFKGIDKEELAPPKEGVTVTEAALEKIASMCLENNMDVSNFQEKLKSRKKT